MGWITVALGVCLVLVFGLRPGMYATVRIAGLIIGLIGAILIREGAKAGSGRRDLEVQCAAPLTEASISRPRPRPLKKEEGEGKCAVSPMGRFWLEGRLILLDGTIEERLTAEVTKREA